MPKISIIVPVYNTEKYLRKCLTSLVNQSLEDIEIIVVNDGSFDNSANIINEFYNKYPSKVIFLYKDNSGLFDSRNVGIEHASGEYIAFVNSDDFIEKNMYEEMYSASENGKLDLVECDFNRFYSSKTKKDYGFSYSNEDDYFLFGRVVAWNKIYKTSIIKENNVLFPCNLKYGDIEFFYKLLPFIKTSSLIHCTFYNHIENTMEFSSSQEEKGSDIISVLNNILMYYKNNNLYYNYLQKLEYLYARVLLKDSFFRIVKIKDAPVRKKLLEKSFEELYAKFPNWKKNILLNSKKEKNKFYYLSTNKFTYKIRSILYSIF